MIRQFTATFLTISALLISDTAVSETIAQTKRYPQFENDEVKVWKSVVAPNTPLPLHRHDHPRVLIALTNGTMKIVGEDGQSETHRWEAGKAYWLPANPPKKLHTDENTGDQPIEVVMVELKEAK